MRMSETKIRGVIVVETTPFTDNRGSFVRFFCQRELSKIIASRSILQVNHSRTASRGAIRGLHFQRAPHAEMKMVRCMRGRVWDVAVDLRQDSPTFLQWHSEELAPDNARILIVPEGCAHGFQTMEPDSELLYLHTAFYEPGSEGGVRYDDPRVAIKWPLASTDISARDLNHPLLPLDFSGIVI